MSKKLSRRAPVLVCVMILSAVTAIEATIVSTAMPQIVGDLGALRLYSLVFSVFLLAQTATTMVFGKLADIYGRKVVLFAGVGAFLLGSILCGFATSMVALIAARLVQGLGSGAIHPLCQTIIGDLYPGSQRGKAQAYLASVWGISSVLGPLGGGLILEHLHWAWIFWINVPIALVASLGFVLFLHEDKRHERKTPDIAGAVLLMLAISALMLVLTESQTMSTATSVSLLAAGGLAAAMFVIQERRAEDPIVALSLWRRRPILTANLAIFFSGGVMMGLTTFLPIYVQTAMGQSALTAGFTLSVMVLGWPIGSTICSRIFPRFGLRPVLIAGTLLLPIGCAVFAFIQPGMSPLVPAAGSFIVGFGMGFLGNAAIVMVQESAGSEARGAATASNAFSRNAGGTIATAMLGALLNWVLFFAGARVTPEQIRALLSHADIAATAESARYALADALHMTFIGILGFAVLTLVAALFVPRVPLSDHRSGTR